MRRKLGLNLLCCTEGRIVQDVEIFLHGAWRIGWINGAVVPVFLRGGVLFVGVSLNQTGVGGNSQPS